MIQAAPAKGGVDKRTKRVKNGVSRTSENVLLQDRIKSVLIIKFKVIDFICKPVAAPALKNPREMGGF